MAEQTSKAAFVSTTKGLTKGKYNETVKKTEAQVRGFSDLPEGLSDSPAQITGFSAGFATGDKKKPYLRFQCTSHDPQCEGKKFSLMYGCYETKKDDGSTSKTAIEKIAQAVNDLMLLGVPKDKLTGKTEEEALAKLYDAFEALSKSQPILLINTSKFNGRIQYTVQGLAEIESSEEAGEPEAAEDANSALDEAASEDEVQEEPAEDADDVVLPAVDEIVYKGKTKGKITAVNEEKETVTVAVVVAGPGGKGKVTKPFTWKFSEISSEAS